MVRLLVLCLLALVSLPALAQDVPALQILWRAPLIDPPSTSWKPREHGGLLLSPSGASIFAASTVGIAAFQTLTGRKLWHVDTTERVDSRLALHGNRLFAVTSSGTLYALDAGTGKAMWAQPTRLDVAVEGPLAADANSIYVVADPGVLFSVAQATGVLNWTYRADVKRDFLVSGQGGALVVGGFAYVGLPSGKLVALSARDGGLTWEVALDRPDLSPYADVDTTPVLVRRSRAVGGDWLLAASHSGGLHAVQASDGTKVWNYPVQALGEPVVIGDRVAIMSAEGALHVLDLKTGRRILARKQTGPVSGVLAAVPDMGVALVPAETGLDLVDLETGRAVLRVLTESGFAAEPVVWHRNVYAVSNGGVLYAFAVRETSASGTLW
jgi:outer membrane protein assembly factor BamB